MPLISYVNYSAQVSTSVNEGVDEMSGSHSGFTRVSPEDRIASQNSCLESHRLKL